MDRRSATTVLTGSAFLLMVIPPLVFVGAALYRGMNVIGTLGALGEQYMAEKTNLLIVSLLGLAPLLLIILFLFFRRLVLKAAKGSARYAWGGSIPVIVVAVFTNLEYWPSYLPARQFLGFPHGLEFVIGPFVFAPIGVLLGLLAAWLSQKYA